ncbi:solute carrier family 41 member 1-like [Scaptodrosophila lebanonensis]|uniref:Solute carrier family 41 member 1-like n=1 Tax=Drosophila lebanonensis TaxID=7225 RepID=A0A6J2T213_DROLE|nr:solute carrier family 41 member 1-like [Scaptodrosophila lebanonensis]
MPDSGHNDNAQSVHEGDQAIYAEHWCCTFAQILIPYFLAGSGTITAGIMLGNVQDWSVFQDMNEIFMLVPALCGLKGNLDMCVASRLSTLSNMGSLQNSGNIREILVGNLALVQVQAIVCSLLLTTTVCIISTVSTPAATDVALHHYGTLMAATLITSSISCLLLDTILMLVILFSQRYSFNPDYMAIPIVASIGDVMSISLLAFSAAVIYDLSKHHIWVSLIVVLIYLVFFLPLWIIIVWHNEFTRVVLKYGWVPVLGALCISQVSGYVLSSAVDEFRGFAVFSPIISGLGGNLVSVQASNMGSILHRRSQLGTLPTDTHIWEWPHHVMLYGTVYSRVSRILLIVSVPGNIVLICSADYLYKSIISVTAIFVGSYVLTSLIQLLILLWVAHSMVHLMWKYKIDPDSAAIPYLTALGDSLGSGLLLCMFYILRCIRQEYQGKRAPWLRISYDDALRKQVV